MAIKVTYIGHSAVYIETSSKKILIDPYITDNPSTSAKPEDFSPDYVLLTHDHPDHYGDLDHYLKQGATFVGIFEFASKFSEKGHNAEPMNIGGTIETGGLKIHMTHATHTCDVGHVAGFVIEADDRQIYHAGDTGLTYDMKILGESFSIDLAFLPIGDRFTMGPRLAAMAAEWVDAENVIPIHYNTWEPIAQSDETIREHLQDRAIILKPGETYELE